ncbi:MAG: thrombospondin type 3 repeat-containing protein [Candidatus Thalassarchaeaceae archaeon]|nr:thrombospondin type 3 repeat-containing protein [Candidatus Thalassarchaeaceae archaeon]
MSRIATAAFMVFFLLISMLPMEHSTSLEEDSGIFYTTNSNDGYSAIEYTDEHTTISIGPSNRQANLRMPGNHDYSRPLPLVVSLHGYSGNGWSNAAYMHHFDSIHENEHLLLYPDGTINLVGMRYWNATDGCCQFSGDVDDANYLLNLINEAIQNYGADPDGIVITGLSNGGFMSHRMACDAGGSIRAIVALNGVTWDDFSKCPDTGRPDILHVHSTADTVIAYNGGAIWGSDYPSATETVGYWADRSGCDSTWTYLGTRDLSGNDGVEESDEFEFLNCNSGNRVAHWRINGGSHVPSLNDPGWANQSIDWALSGFVRDSDGDSYRDDVDAFIYNPNEWADADGDLVGDNTDQCDQDPNGWDDSDGDGVCVPDDLFPDDSNEWSDADGDGIGDNGDPDDDNDGFDDDVDAFPLDSSEWYDTDEDGIGNNADSDDDSDGWLDSEDAFPLDASEWADFDEDGIGDNADLDDDNDGWADLDEVSCETNPNDVAHIPLDSDEDGICDLVDSDDDDDGIDDYQDVFPLNPEEWFDSDEDGVGDNSDVFPADDSEWLDSDEDGVGDNSDVFPNDPTEWGDIDGDGIGDNIDEFPEDRSEWIDSDSDGVGDNGDAFPNDPSETTDTDLDGVGDNSDVFPTYPSEWIDSDEDGFGDNSDAFPSDPDEWLDTDGDGYGDNRDWAPFDSKVWDEPPDNTIMIVGGIIVLIVGVLVYTGRRQA